MKSNSLLKKPQQPNQQDPLIVFKMFQKFSQKVLEQLQMFESLQAQLDQLISESGRSTLAQKKLKQLEANNFFEKNEHLFSVLENFCHHLCDLSKQMRQLQHAPSKKLARSPAIKSASTKRAVGQEATTHAAVPLKKSKKIPPSSSEPAQSDVTPNTTAAPLKVPLSKKVPALKLPRTRKNIISIPGGFL